MNIMLTCLELEQEFQKDNANNITLYRQWYDPNGQAWCAMFVSFCAYQARIIDTIVYHNANSGYIPKIGDIIFL